MRSFVQKSDFIKKKINDRADLCRTNVKAFVYFTSLK